MRKLLQIILRGFRWARADKLFILCKWIQPRVIAMVDGGLASQMWQFALGYAAAEKTGLPLYLDITWFKNCGRDLNGQKNRHFLLLSAFPRVSEYLCGNMTTLDEISRWFMRFYSDVHTKREMFAYSEQTIPRHSVYLGQYYCHCKYILPVRQKLAELFKLNPELTSYESALNDAIQESCSCALHIRKGDFVGSVHDVCSESYYLAAMQKMEQLHPDVRFFVFSNNEKWTHDFIARIGYGSRCVVVENRGEDNPVVDIWLMQQCKHAIISNSGFSFMPAFLSYSSEKTVITPKYWLRDANKQLREDTIGAYCMDGWIAMDN